MENRKETRGIDKLEVARKDNENNEINYMGFKAMPFIIGETLLRCNTTIQVIYMHNDRRIYTVRCQFI